MSPCCCHETLAVSSVFKTQSRDLVESLSPPKSTFPYDHIQSSLLLQVNQAEGIINDTETKMDEYKDKIPSEEYEKLKVWSELFQ